MPAMRTIAFFNNKGGVGRTSLVFHLAWMYAEMGVSVVVADLDPQANLTRMFLSEQRMEELWSDEERAGTVYGAVRPLLGGTGDIGEAHVEAIEGNLGLVVGDLALATTEDEMSSQWALCLDRKERAFRVISAFWRILETAAQRRDAGLVLIDVGPNLGAINRAALIAAQHVVIPLAPDLFSLQGLKNLGPTLRDWREGWEDRLRRPPLTDLPVPAGEMTPAGYVVLQHAIGLDRPVQAYDQWIARIPSLYRQVVLHESTDERLTGDEDPHRLAMLKHYRSLMPLALEVRKPMFHLRPADGAIGGHSLAVQTCFADFRQLATRIADRCHVPIPA